MRNIFFTEARDAKEWVEDIDPNVCIEKLKGQADIFTFWDRLPSGIPIKASLVVRSKVFCDQDNIAAIPLVSYDHWWKNQIGRKTRNMVRKAQKMGVEAVVVSLTDDLIATINRIFKETPVRQGKPFRHYGTTFEQTKPDLAEAERYPPEFISATYKEETIGFLHIIYSKETAVIDLLLSMQKYWDKAPNNILIAKAVEVACQKGMRYLIYEKMPEGSLGEFKRNNAFQKMWVTRYYVPLSFKGNLVLKLRLQRGLQDLLPVRLQNSLRPMRNRLLWWVSAS